MFYNVPYEGLKKVRITELKTHSFIEREIKLLQYVMDRSLVDLEKIEMDFPSMSRIFMNNGFASQ